MSENKEMNKGGVFRLATAVEGGKSVLQISICEPYVGKPVYRKTLERIFKQSQTFDSPFVLKSLALKDDAQGHPVLTVAWEDARSLTDYLKENHSDEEKKRLVSQVASALSYLHGLKLIHGALGPATIFVTKKSNDVRVLFFKQHYVDNLSQPQVEQRFIAPEVKDGSTLPTARVDIFSLGALLKELRLDADFYDVIRTSCSYSASQRYGSVDEFVDGMEHRRKVRRSSSSPSFHASLPGKRFFTGVACVLILAGIGYAGFYFYKNNPFQSDDAQATVTQTTQTNADSVQHATAATDSVATPSYTGELEFLATLVPQMQKDLDKMYEPFVGGKATEEEKTTLKQKLVRYYKGLRATLKGKTAEQLAAYDEAFASYRKAKDAQL